MNRLLRCALVNIKYATFAAGVLCALLFLTAASAATWGAPLTFWLLMLGVLALVGFCQRLPAPREPARDGAADLRAPIDNAQHKFGEAGAYYRAEIIDGGGNRRAALFTHEQLMTAVRRARRNPEDLAAEAPMSFDEEVAALAAGGGPLAHLLAPACVAVGRWWEGRRQRKDGDA